MSLFEVNNISFSYPSGGFKINNLNLDLEQGDFTTIVGPNGSGKTTLIKLLSGYYSPQEGEILFGGKNIGKINKKNLAREIAYVPQNTSTIFPYTVYEIVEMGRTPYLNYLGYSSNHDSKIISEILDVMEISHLADKGINSVSGGEAQRAFIARALVQQPKVLLLDEPNAHLDIGHQIEIFKLLSKMKIENEISIICVMHDFNLPGKYSNKIILMNEGEIFCKGSKQKVFTSDNIEKVFGVDSVVNYSKEEDLITVMVKA